MSSSIGDKTVPGPVRAIVAAATSQRPRAGDRSSPVEAAIFAATEQLLEEHSARDLSVAQILERSRVSRATFYHYFGSKWEVVNYLAAATMQRIYEHVEQFASGVAGADGASSRDALRTAIVEGCQIWAEHRAVLRAVLDHWREVPELRSLLSTVLEPFQVALARQLDAERAAGTAPPGPDSGGLVAALLWSTLSCLHVAGLPDVEQISDETHAAVLLTDIWMRTLYGDLPPG